MAGVHGGSEPGQSSSRSNKDRVHKEEVGKPAAGHLPPSPHQADKPRNEKSEVGEASRGRGGVCVCGQEEVSGCLDGCIGGGAAGKSEEPQCTCITTT